LEVAIAFINFFLALLVMRVSWLRSILECPLDLIALFDSVVVVLVPQTLLFEEVFEATRGLLRTVLRMVLDSRDSVIWLELAVRTRVSRGR
jgi:hypothetical protein